MRDRLIVVVAVVVAAGIALASCSDPDTPTADSAAPAPATTSPTTGGTTPEPVGSEPGTVDETPTTAAAEAAAPPTGDAIAVPSSAIPAEVANALRENGGELADTDDWTARFHPTGIPIITGTGVTLVEASLSATATTSAWQRTDALQWLFTSTTTRDDLLDQLAFDAGIGNVAPSIETSTIDAADCVVRRYRADTVDWQLQGCSFEQFPNMVSVGVSRTAASTSEAQLAGLDPSIGSVLDDLDGAITAIEVTFGAPEPGSTSTLTATVEVATTDPDPARTLRAGALATWPSEDGEAGLVSFTGSPGSHWNVTPAMTRFTHEGRLAP